MDFVLGFLTAIFLGFLAFVGWLIVEDAGQGDEHSG
jgi:hypothetical protein